MNQKKNPPQKKEKTFPTPKKKKLIQIFQKRGLQSNPLSNQKKQPFFFNMKGTLFLSTFDKTHLHRNIEILETILLLFKKKNILNYKKIGQPTRKKHQTLLRSPHIDKKSREQYIRIFQKKVFELSFYNSKVFSLFYSHVQNYAFRGASLFFEWNTQDYLFPTKNIRN